MNLKKASLEDIFLELTSDAENASAENNDEEEVL